MTLPFDDFNDTSVPGGTDPGQVTDWDWFEIEASGPGLVNRVAFVSGLATPGLAGTWPRSDPDSDSVGIGDGILDIDTGYELDLGSGGVDQVSKLVRDQEGPLASVYVALGSLAGKDDTVNAWLESADIHFDTDALLMSHLKIRVKLNASGAVSISRITYQVVLLLHSTRPPESEPRLIAVK
jgi:hypothetical protein